MQETIEINAKSIIVEHTIAAVLLDVLMALEQRGDVIGDTHVLIESIICKH
jgi:hypothetical protein